MTATTTVETPRLTSEQLAAAEARMVRNGRPVRFLFHGQNLNILTGELRPKGINVIHQIVYWCMPTELARDIASWLGVRAVFCDDEKDSAP